VFGLAAQEPVRPILDGFTYPALARAARIEGTVEFVVNANRIQFVSGHPMLAAAAESNLEKWAVKQASETPLSVTYHFGWLSRNM
jgi:outer membrane biosynthesis protein TonB